MGEGEEEAGEEKAGRPEPNRIGSKRGRQGERRAERW